MPPPNASVDARVGALRRISPSVLRWLASLALMLPVIVLYAANYLRGDGATFTGFIQYDQASYMADARKSFDGGFHFLYSNPFSPDPNSPGIYFHAHLLVLGFIRAVTGGDPGTIYVIFGFFAALVAVRVAMALYEEIAGLESTAQWVGLVMFIWGGGVLAITGLVFHLVHGSTFHETVTDLFHFDPSEGWWFLNFGRNLVFPTEAYYHALAFGAVLAAMQRKFRLSLWLAVLLSFSHPFTGLEFLLILVAWCGVEAIVTGQRSIPFAYGTLLICVLAFHLIYNLGLLNLFPEHVAVFRQWSLPWNVPLSAWLPADVLVGALTIWALGSRAKFSEAMAQPAHRLLLTWFVVAFALSHHDLVVQPRQPLHFERGYVWAPLFLLGIRPLLDLIRNTFGMRNALARTCTLGAILLFALSDNLAWFGLHTAMAMGPRINAEWLGSDGYRLTRADYDLYKWLNSRPEPHDELLVTTGDLDNNPIVYLAMTYTDYRAWYSHYAATPFAAERWNEVNNFNSTREIPEGWRGRSVLILTPLFSDKKISNTLPMNQVYQNDQWAILESLVPYR